MPSTIGDGEPAAGINDAVEALQRASEIPAKQRSVKVSGTVSIICSHAFNHGLDADQLRLVVRIASRKTELDQSSVTSLVKNLYPAQRVPSDVVISVVAALGQGKGKPSPGTQNSFVRWLTIVHAIIEDPTVLSRMYGVLFEMLDMISIRTPLCHLLSLITRRKHVKPFRIQQLLELSRGLGNEPALQGLLRVYKDYYPDIILGSTATTRNSFPPRPDPEWQTRLRAIQAASTASDEAKLEPHNGFRVLRKGAKRGKVSLIPDVHTFRANETSVTLEEIDNVEAFVEKLERIEPPGQVISFLNDPLLQKYVALNPSPITAQRIDLWLSTYLEEEYTATKAGSPPSADFPELLEGLLRQTQYNKQNLPIVLSFLEAYLPIWDGTTAAESILGLLSYIPIQPFQKAHTTYLSPAETAYISSNPHSLHKLLNLYTSLLLHWTNAITTSPSPTPSPHLTTSLHTLSTHITHLSTSLFLSNPTQSLTSSILSHYTIQSHISHPTLLPILTPPQTLSYLLAFTPPLTNLSQTCGIYAATKTAFDGVEKPTLQYPASTLNPFNTSLRDLWNVIWAGKAFTTAANDPKRTSFLPPTQRDALQSYLYALDRNYSLNHVFTLSYHPCISSVAAKVWRAMEEEEVRIKGYDREDVNWHVGPVTRDSLERTGQDRGVGVGWEEYRWRVLGYLGDRGEGGLEGFVRATHRRDRKGKVGGEGGGG